MPILDLNNEKEVRRYNEFLNSSKHTRITQAICWGKVKENWKHEIVYIEEEGKIVAGMLILIKKVLNTALFYSPRGPVCDAFDIEIVNRLINEVKILAKKYNAFCLKFDPGISETEELRKLYENNEYIVSGNEVNADHLIQPRYDFVLDIKDRSAEQILKDMSGNTRYKINKASRKGVVTTFSNTKEALDIFWKLNEMTIERKNVALRSYEYFERLLNSYDKENIRIYLTKHEEDYLTAAIGVTKGPEMYYLYAATSDKKRNMQANYLMIYEMIKWAVEKKCTMFNLGGMPVYDEEDGLYEFKVRFTGKEGLIKYIGEIDKVYKPIYYFGYSKFLPFVRKIIGFFG